MAARPRDSRHADAIEREHGHRRPVRRVHRLHRQIDQPRRDVHLPSMSCQRPQFQKDGEDEGGRDRKTRTSRNSTSPFLLIASSSGCAPAPASAPSSPARGRSRPRPTAARAGRRPTSAAAARIFNRSRTWGHGSCLVLAASKTPTKRAARKPAAVLPALNSFGRTRRRYDRVHIDHNTPFISHHHVRFRRQ